MSSDPEYIRNYMRRYMLARYYSRRALALQMLGGCCVVCQVQVKLEIDHINPKEKEFSFKQLWNMPLAKFVKELAKCQLLCEKHHWQKSKLERFG